MNTKIKIFIVGIIALWGLFNSFNNVSAQTVVAHCDSATLTGTVYPNGSPTEAWFDWGPTIPPAYHTARRTFYSTSSYSDIITGLTPSTRYFYRAMAQNAGGLATGDTKDFYTPACPVPNPTVNIYANPSSIQYGGNSTLSWTSTNATSCSASWTTSTATSGSKVVYPTKTITYSIVCTGPGGDASDSVTITVSPILQPSVNLEANPINIKSGESSTLFWNSSNAISCSTSGSKTIYPTSTTTYSITCNGASGSTPASDSVTVKVEPQILKPTVQLTADDTSLDYGGSTYIRWTSVYATSCNGTGGSNGWSGPKNTTGSFYTGALNSTKTYNITCINNTGSANDSVTVNH